MYDTTVVQNQITIVGNHDGPAVPYQYGTPNRGVNVAINVNNVIGNPNVLFHVETSPDGLSWFDNAYHEGGPIDTVGTYHIHFASANNFFRLSALYETFDPGDSSNNSSSSSSQSFASSSSGGSSSLSYSAQLTIAKLP